MTNDLEVGLENYLKVEWSSHILTNLKFRYQKWVGLAKMPLPLISAVVNIKSRHHLFCCR